MSKRIYLRPDREGPLHRFHPWIFSGAVQKIDPNLKNGDFVIITSSNNKDLAYAYYNEGSIIAKIFYFYPSQDLDPNTAIESQLLEAFLLRKNLGLLNNSSTNCYRLVNAEGDSLPGLTIDIYNSTAIIQFNSLGMYLNKEFITKKILSLYNNNLACIFSKKVSTQQFNKDEVLWGELKNESLVLENNLKYLVNYQSGQKTGFFIDQRLNRLLVQSHAKDRKVLNAFSYTGGFSVSALAGGAKSVVSLDISDSALALCQKNVELNFVTDRHQVESKDYFKSEITGNYDMIILDPPALAKSMKKKNEAIKAYQVVNFKAFNKILNNSLIYTFSCTQVVSSEEFTDAVMYAAYKAGRKVKILQELGAADCHPRSLFHREGKYLKGLFLAVN